VDLAGPSAHLTPASAVLLQVLNAVITSQARDQASIGQALNSAATQHGLSVPDAARARLVALLQQLGALDYGPYAGHGFALQDLGPETVRLVPASGS
jgi:hypothetical protein